MGFGGAMGDVGEDFMHILKNFKNLERRIAQQVMN